MAARGVSHSIIEQIADEDPGSPFRPLGLPRIQMVCAHLLSAAAARLGWGMGMQGAAPVTQLQMVLAPGHGLLGSCTFGHQPPP